MIQNIFAQEFFAATWRRLESEWKLSYEIELER